MRMFPYLHFNGDCEAAFQLYARVLGGEVKNLLRHAGSPAEATVPKEWGEKILHAHMEVAGTALLASDAPPGHYRKPQGFSLTVIVPSPEEAERVFAALSEGGKVQMAMAPTFFASRWGMLEDRFGVPWMVMSEPAA